MNPAEYKSLELVDQEHWFYTGKRAIVRYWLQQHLQLKKTDLLVDAGMGTGRWLAAMSTECRVIGIDDHIESLALSQSRAHLVTGRILARINQLPLKDHCARVVTVLDVLEHLEDDIAGLRELLRILHPNGLMILTVPAHKWLWSDWDTGLHHYRRYDHKTLQNLVQSAHGTIIDIRPFNTIALPMIAIARWSRRFFSSQSHHRQRLEDRIPPHWINRCLYHTMVYSACRANYHGLMGASLLALVKPQLNP